MGIASILEYVKLYNESKKDNKAFACIPNLISYL